MWLRARGLSVYKQCPSILSSCLDAASEDRVLGMSLVLTTVEEGDRKKCRVLRTHIIVWVLAELSASVLHSRPLDPFSNAVVFFTLHLSTVSAVLMGLSGTD